MIPRSRNRSTGRLYFALGLACVSILGRPLLAQSPTTKSPPSVDWAAHYLPSLIDLYRHFHTHPELSYHELETAARLADEWRKLGFQVTTGVGKQGVVALLENGPGKTLMLRADMDALPVVEETNLAYSSTVRVPGPDGGEVGVMHACGHDIHMANIVGVARFLTDHRDRWSGTLILIGQPAEEKGAGALAMLEDGLFERFPKPDFALALHVSPELPAGTVGYRAGYALANVNSVDITMQGKGGHGAYPHMTTDPIVMASELVLSLQTLVSREINPVDSAVVTVGSIHGGTKHNIIGDSCRLQLTVRSYSDEVREQLLRGIERKARAIAEGALAPEPTVRVSEGTPSLSNDRELVERVVPIFREVLGTERVIETPPTMGGEDFSQFGRAGVPIFMFWLGTIEEERLTRMKELGQTIPSLHSSRYYPDAAPSLVTGVGCMGAAAVELLKKE